MGQLTDKVAIVTGGSGGIGRATAARFVREGARVVLVDRDASSLEAAARAVGGGESVATVAADVSSAEGVARYVRATLDRFDGIDVVFANAGIEGAVAPITEYPIEDFDRVLAVNVRGVFLAIRETAPLLAKRGGGSIIATSSVAGLIGSSGLSAYVASKHAVLGLVKTAAVELAPLGIRVNAVNPGPIENRMMRSIEEQASPGHASAVKERFLDLVPMRRYGTNDEVAEVALFLASGASSYCTGGAFVVDGGFAVQ